MKIAIDGPSGAGKSTLSKAVAARLGIVYVDTGALYRTVGYAVRQLGIDPHDTAAVIGALDGMRISLRYEDGVQCVYLNGENLGNRIREPEISMYASKVSAIPEVRNFLLGTQRKIAAENDVIMDGRDIGTVVFPDAELKIFMTADPAIRAQRRYKELEVKGEKVSLEEVERNLRERDHADQTRAVSPLRQAEDAVVLDNSHMTLPEQMDWVMRRIEKITCAPCTSK